MTIIEEIGEFKVSYKEDITMRKIVEIAHMNISFNEFSSSMHCLTIFAGLVPSCYGPSNTLKI